MVFDMVCGGCNLVAGPIVPSRSGRTAHVLPRHVSWSRDTIGTTHTDRLFGQYLHSESDLFALVLLRSGSLVHEHLQCA